MQQNRPEIDFLGLIFRISLFGTWGCIHQKVIIAQKWLGNGTFQT